MPLRNGQEYLKQEYLKKEHLKKEHLKQDHFNPKNQPFKLVLLPEKMPRAKYKVNINFDEASLEWRKNKVPNAAGGFIYKRFSERVFNRR